MTLYRFSYSSTYNVLYCAGNEGWGDLHLEVDHIRARPTIKECEAQQPDVL